MSETPHNDIERDAELTAIYRAAAQDAPPAALDEAIRAAARRAVVARPRPAGFSFSHAWRMPLSIAAVMVLSVSIVMLMREEAPELTVPPRAHAPNEDAKLQSRVGADDSAAPADAGFVRDEQKPKNIGLKPPQPASSSGLGMRAPEYLEQAARPKKDAVAERLDADTAAPAALAKRRDAPAAEADSRSNKVAASTERQRQSALAEPPREIAQAPAAAASRVEVAKPAQLAEPVAARPSQSPASGVVAGRLAENNTPAKTAAADRREPESRVQLLDPAKTAAEALSAPAPAAKPVSPAVAMSKLERAVDLAPEKWLERIEELRKQGKLEEAKASLAEFRKRYPDYRLPDSLRDWAKP